MLGDLLGVLLTPGTVVGGNHWRGGPLKRILQRPMVLTAFTLMPSEQSCASGRITTVDAERYLLRK